MSAEELLQELLCQRLEQDFQLLRPRNLSKLLTLRKEQTYYLSQGSQVLDKRIVSAARRLRLHACIWQVQQITFVQDGQAHVRPSTCCAPTSKSACTSHARNRTSGDTSTSRWHGSREPSATHGRRHYTGSGVRTASESALGFSEILVTRHLMHHRHDEIQRAPSHPIGYYYQVCGPHGVGYQEAFTEIRSTSPYDFPWNRLDQIVCGWDCDLDLGLRLRCKRFALLDFHEQREDSLRRLLSAPEGTQRLLSAAMATHEIKTPATTIGTKSALPATTPSTGAPRSTLPAAPLAPCTASTSPLSGLAPGDGGTGVGTQEPERDPSAPTLSRDRFERFVAAVRTRLPIGDRVQWMNEVPPWEEQEGSTVDASAQVNIAPRTHRRLLDMTPSDSPAAAVADGCDSHQLGARRMFVQLLFDASASADASWHLEIRWNMCSGDRVEELVKYCARRAKQAGMLLLQVPTGRRPRPFSPPVLVPISKSLQPLALVELRTRLCFVRESSHAGDVHAGRN